MSHKDNVGLFIFNYLTTVYGPFVILRQLDINLESGRWSNLYTQDTRIRIIDLLVHTLGNNTHDQQQTP